MGRGPNERNDPPMGKPVDLGAAASVEDSVDDEPSYCATQRELSFEIERSASLAIGDEVSLRSGDPVEVLRVATLVGFLGKAEGKSMTSCIDFGYRMLGAVTAVDPVLGVGKVQVAGIRGA